MHFYGVCFFLSLFLFLPCGRVYLAYEIKGTTWNSIKYLDQMRKSTCMYTLYVTTAIYDRKICDQKKEKKAVLRSTGDDSRWNFVYQTCEYVLSRQVCNITWKTESTICKHHSFGKPRENFTDDSWKIIFNLRSCTLASRADSNGHKLLWYVFVKPFLNQIYYAI